MVGSRVVGSCLLVALGLLPVLPAQAGAVTSVSGDEDSNAPLVIDPSTNPTGASTSTSSPGSQPVMFVQKMPVTKVVDQVTLGDLAVGPGCAAGTATAKIQEYETGALGGSATAQFFSLGTAAISTTPSKLTWSFAPTKLRKGHGYLFVASASDCSTLTRTTWAHNEAQINPGPAVCTAGPEGWRRMWHQNGQDDAVAGCVDLAAGQRRFDPSMPTGWLVSQIAQDGSGKWDVVWFTDVGGGTPCYTPYPPNTYEKYGGAPVFWKSTSGFPSYPQYVCQWTQWAPHGLADGDLPEHGWYYAQPWLPTPAAGPRDMYLKLKTINYDALLEAYVPILRYDTDEDFHAISPGAATDFYDASDDPDDPEDANRLVDSSGAFASANPFVAFDEEIDALDLDYLGSAYTGSGPRGGTDAESTDYVSERGDGSWGPFFSSDGFADDASYMETLPGYANRVYGRVAHGSDGKLWLQYWFYYYFDSQGNFGQSVHEGDWEMIQVGLSTASSPDVAAYAQHGDGERCMWQTDVETVIGRPVVYVAQGSHASYVRSGHYDDPDPDDDANGNGMEVINPTLVQIRSQTPSWVEWPGTWGDTDESPPGPAFQPGEKWADPTTWANGLHNCDAS